MPPNTSSAARFVAAAPVYIDIGEVVAVIMELVMWLHDLHAVTVVVEPPVRIGLMVG